MMRGDANSMQINVLDGPALRTLVTELNSSKYAIDAHNRSISEIGNLSELPKLFSLDVSFNTITSLRNISTASKLRELKIYNNKLTNTIGLKANLNLEDVQMNDNQIEDISSDFLALGRLKNLWLSGNKIASVHNLQGCRFLVQLDLGRNMLQGAASEGLDALTNLEHLNLNGNQLTSIGNLAHLTKLQELNLSENMLTTLQGIMPFNLEVLRVNGNRLSGFHDLQAPMSKLNELYAYDNVITSLESLPHRCPQLESVDLRNNQIALTSQITDLAMCTTLQDIWLQGNPCCFSSNYLIDLLTAFTELKTLDTFTDVQLQSCRESLKKGNITHEELLHTARACTPSYRPGTASSRPGSSRSRTSSGRPATPDSAPVFHTPSARIGNVAKLTGADELTKAQEEVRKRLQKMKRLLNRVVSGIENASPAGIKDDSRHVNAMNRDQRRSSAPVESIPTASESDAVTRTDFRQVDDHDAAKVPSSPLALSTSVDCGSKTKPMLKHVQRARTVQSLIRRSYADASTDPFESLMSNNKPVVVKTATPNCEMETQTISPPAPILSSAKSAFVRGTGSESSLPTEPQREQNHQDNATPEEAIEEALDGDTRRDFQQDGDAIEAEMKQFLIQHVVDSSSSNQNNANEQPEEDIDSGNFWSDSPRLDIIKTAELRKAPTSLSKTGYRTFRMPSRPRSSNNI